MTNDSPPSPRAAVLRTALLLFAVPLVPALLTAWLHPRRPDWSALRAEAVAPAPGRMRLAELRAAWPDALWVDARPADAFAAGHVPGAVPLNEDDWETGFAALAGMWDGRRGIVVYCGGEGCQASEAVARRLRRDLGFDRVVVLEGGWDAWRTGEGSGRR